MTTVLPVLYVSYKGGSGTGPVNNVSEIRSDGSVNPDLVLTPGTNGCPELLELRGLWLLPDGDLYVCDAQKDISKVLLFDGGSDGIGRTYKQTVAGYDETTMPALQHPYGVAVYGGTLYVSAQDSNYVSWYGIGADGAASPDAPCHYLAHTLGGTYPAGGFVGCAHPPVSAWTPVKKHDGGLGDSDKNGHKASVRGFAFDGSGTLYVADEAHDRVTMFDAARGTYRGHIEHADLSEPVGIAVSPADGAVYIGSKKAGKVLRYDPSSGDLKQVGDAIDTPSGIAVDAGGKLYVASRKGRTIKYLDTSDDTFKDLTTSPLPDEPECIIALPGSADRSP